MVERLVVGMSVVKLYKRKKLELLGLHLMFKLIELLTPSPSELCAVHV